MKTGGTCRFFYIAILCEAIQACSEFSFGPEAALLGITLPAALPVPGSKLALLGSPEMAPSKPAGGELKRTMFPPTQRTSPSKRISFLPCSRGALGLPGWWRRGCRGKRRWEIPPGSTARCSRPFSLVLACEDGYKLENETCVRYGDCSALLLPRHPCSGDLLAQLSC